MRAIAILALCVVAAYGADESQYAYNYLSDTGCRTAAQGPTVGLQRMCQWLEDNYSGQPWWQSDCGHVPSRTTSLHCAGRAIDWVMNGCTSAGLAEGNRIVSYLVANNGAQAKARGVQTIIWRGKIWTKNGDFSERAYTTQGVGYTCSQGNTAAKTQSHWDHVHLDLNIWGSRNFPYGGAAPTNAPAPAPAGCTTKFCNNQQVRFTTVVNLRSTASPTGTKVATSTNGEIATVVGGPTNNGGYEWFQLRRASGTVVWATHGGQDWYVLYRGTGNSDVAPEPTIIAPANTTVYSDICIEGTTKNVTQSFFTILAQSVDSCGKSWYEVEVTGDTNTWYLPFDNTTMMYNAGAPEAEEPSDIDVLGSVGRAAPSLVVAAVAVLFAMRV